MNTDEVIDGQWYFRLDLENQGLGQRWFAKDLELRDWLSVTIPHHFGGPPLNLPGVEGFGWYRIVIDGRPNVRGERWFLRFEAANYRTKVWVNGKSVGSHEHGGYTPFEVDITRALTDGPTQRVAILVDNVRRTDRCPAKVFAWRNIGGIYRDVRLLKTFGERIEFVRLHDGGAAGGPIKVHVDCRVSGSGMPAVVVTGPYLHGKPAGKKKTMSIKMNSGGRGEAELPARYRWSPERPYLFQVTAELRHKRQLLDRKSFTTGFRTVTTKGNQFLLNGNRCWVNGMNYLPDTPESGMLMDLRTLEADLRRIKSLGANTIRAHFAMHRRAYELCDELGLMVWHDIPMYWWHDRDGLAWGPSHMEAFAAHKAQIGKLIEYDFNHPSVVMRIMANECGFYTKASRAAMRSVCAESKRLDATRLTTICAYVQQEEGVDLGVDAILCNFYREHQDKTIRALPREVKPTVQRLKRTAKLFPDKPIFVAEVGFEGASHCHGDAYSTEDFQAAAFAEYWKQLTRTKLISGFCFWCWADYRYIESKPWGESFRSASPSLGCFGVVSEDRRHAKAAFDVVRACFSQQLRTGGKARPKTSALISRPSTPRSYRANVRGS